MWTEEMRKKIENRLGLTALNIYGLTEIIGPGVAQECMQKQVFIYLKIIFIQK